MVPDPAARHGGNVDPRPSVCDHWFCDMARSRHAALPAPIDLLQVPAFEEWLAARGLGDGTKGVYTGDVRMAAAAGGFIARLTDDGLAPKTRQHSKAAARRWADFTGDEKLEAAIKQIRLPPAVRQKPKVPLEREQLFAIVDELDGPAKKYLDPEIRAVIGLMACRGLRVGDALRIRRDEIQRARDTGVLSHRVKGSKQLEFKVLKTYRRWVVQLADMADAGSWNRVSRLVSPHAQDDKTAQRAAARRVERGLFVLGRRLHILNLHPHRLRRTYAVEYLRSLKGDPEALVKLTQHLQWASMATALEYVNHARGDELDSYAERIFERDA